MVSAEDGHDRDGLGLTPGQERGLVRRDGGRVALEDISGRKEAGPLRAQLVGGA